MTKLQTICTVCGPLLGLTFLASEAMQKGVEHRRLHPDHVCNIKRVKVKRPRRKTGWRA